MDVNFDNPSGYWIVLSEGDMNYNIAPYSVTSIVMDSGVHILTSDTDINMACDDVEYVVDDVSLHDGTFGLMLSPVRESTNCYITINEEMTIFFPVVMR